MSTVINVENLGKRYFLRHQSGQQPYVALRDVLADGVSNLGRKLFRLGDATVPGTVEEEFWALKDVSFEVKQGDRIGIIGRNGAGKSTLLKVLSRITEPTAGSVRIKGRVASLLEVGTGFHPELTGRENIYLNGAILGMSRVEIRKKFDEIVDFAEIEKFLDTPVKRYSSGMYVRLAFAVAAHLEPEILVVDEVLAVGDAQFQKKCLGKMKDVGRAGRTILFVSHNMAAVRNLCSAGILLDKGKIVSSGEIQDVADRYQGGASLTKNEIHWTGIDAPGNEKIRLASIVVRPLHGSILDIDSGLSISTTFDNLEADRSLDFTIYLYNMEGICIFETGVIISDTRAAKAGRYQAVGEIPGHLLNAGAYKISIIFGESQRYVLYQIDDVLSFEIDNTTTGRGHNMNRAPGIIRPRLLWSWNYLE